MAGGTLRRRADATPEPADRVISLALALLLSTADPAGDAFGDGSLAPPAAAVYRDAGAFDLREVRLLEGEALQIAVTLGSLPDPGDLPLGFSLPVVEVYLDIDEGGPRDLLPGSGMRLPPDAGWEIAIRLTGDDASGYRINAVGDPVRLPVGVEVEGATIRVTTPFEAPRDAEVYALTGLYDALGSDVWRPVTRGASTWSFSSPEQRRPVVDLLAPNAEAQATAVESGVLPPPRRSRGAAFYPLLMGLGLAVALVGLLLRRRVGRETEASEASRPGPASEGADGDGSGATAEPLESGPPGEAPGHRTVVAGEDGAATPPARPRPPGWNGEPGGVAAPPASTERAERDPDNGAPGATGAPVPPEGALGADVGQLRTAATGSDASPTRKTEARAPDRPTEFPDETVSATPRSGAAGAGDGADAAEAPEAPNTDPNAEPVTASPEAFGDVFLDPDDERVSGPRDPGASLAVAGEEADDRRVRARGDDVPGEANDVASPVRGSAGDRAGDENDGDAIASDTKAGGDSAGATKVNGESAGRDSGGDEGQDRATAGGDEAEAETPEREDRARRPEPES